MTRKIEELLSIAPVDHTPDDVADAMEHAHDPATSAADRSRLFEWLESVESLEG